MRIENQSIKIRSVLFSKPMSVVYFVLFCIFFYKSAQLFPTWFNLKEKAEKAERDLERKQAASEDIKEGEMDKKTELGQERYKKEFFNKLDEGENLIILYGSKEEEKRKEEERKMFWWQEKKQDFLVWWRNLEIF
jgi:hypothetical protein